MPLKMRLLHTETLELCEFTEHEIPPYAILSHTWERDEVSYRDIVGAGPGQSYKSKAGWTKIQGCCRHALRDGLEFVWVDTCCIDKSSSAELQEAINSMFTWYEMSQICYAYLVDVPPGDQPTADNSNFRRSRWFTRGWTLQELIAPTLVLFMDQTWTEIGTRYALRTTVSEITGIGEDILVGAAFGARRAMRDVSVAQRMSWASNRATTRTEDMAYCLLGIFEINIPLLYGEGNKAFQRLQEEIIKVSNDQSILAWGFLQAMPGLWGTSFALAQSPSAFAECSDLKFYGVLGSGDHFSMTQRGLQLHLPLVEKDDGAIVYCLLSCGPSDPQSDVRQCLAVPMLRHRGSPSTMDEYSRMSLKTPVFMASTAIPTWQRKPLYLPRYWTNKGVIHWRYHLHTNVGPKSPPDVTIGGIYPPAITSHDQIVLDNDQSTVQTMVHIHRTQRPNILVLLRRHVKTMVQYSASYPPLETTYRPNPSSRLSRIKPLVQDSRVKPLVREAIRNILGIRREDLEDDHVHLSDLGMDSLSSLHLVRYLQQETRLPLDMGTFTGCVSVRDVEKRLGLLTASQALVEREGVKLEKGTRFPKIFLGDLVEFKVTELPEDSSLLQLPTDMTSWDSLKSYFAEFDLGEAEATPPTSRPEKLQLTTIHLPLNSKEDLSISLKLGARPLKENGPWHQAHPRLRIDIVPTSVSSPSKFLQLLGMQGTTAFAAKYL